MFVSITADAVSEKAENPYTFQLMQGVANNYPEVLSYIQDWSSDAKEIDCDFGGHKSELLRVPVNRRLYTRWLNPWLAKQTAALWYYETKEILDKSKRISVTWLPVDTFIFSGAPIKICEILPFVGEMATRSQSFGSKFSYRYSLSNETDFGAFLIIYRDCVAGFAVVAPSEMFIRYNSQIRVGDLFRPVPGRGLEMCLELPLAIV
ncbi:hypothetical protein [Pseudotabrizicola algicola]|uniref:Uncharacterized protein n=1 Tax=Pseudotabrizicola algicola TaxID=2709381 RepID=A0A6B3RRK7_9RHOB|nr:hypothetical protein [Pseudotabrizicola algicola]NEX47766.1 hypothetical protein [Pseudotabrizicola algicola]